MRLAICVLTSALLVSALVVRAEHSVPQPALRAAAENGLRLLIATSPTFIKKGGCNSCHNQALPAAAQAFAKRKGLAVGAPIEQLPDAVSESTTERYLEYSVGGGAGVTSLGFDLFAKALAGVPADARLRAQIRYLKTQQQPDGHWRGGAGALVGGNQAGGSRAASARPPLTFDDFTPTAYMIRALATYAPASEAADTEARIARARAWLLAATPGYTQERAFRLLGLTWSHAEEGSVQAAAGALAALQREDGGWAQLPSLASDAYATGVALFALAESGTPVTSRAYQAGLRYLLATQAADGTWHVKSRSLLFQPYFESGYPYGRDQWISAAAASYASLAIAAAVAP